MISPQVAVFHNYIVHPSVVDGISCLMQGHGLSRFSANVVVAQFPEQWQDAEYGRSCEELLAIVRHSMMLRMGVILVCRPAAIREALRDSAAGTDAAPALGVGSRRYGFTGRESPPGTSSPSPSPSPGAEICNTVASTAAPPTIDVHMLADEGGLPILLAHLLTRNRSWRRYAVRIFVPVRDQLDGAVAVAADPNCSNPHCYPNPNPNASPHSHLVSDPAESDASAASATDSVAEMRELLTIMRIAATAHPLLLPAALSSRRSSEYTTDPYSCYGEAILRASENSQLVFIVMPVPTHAASADGFFRCLSALSCPDRIRCPVLFVRGNQENVMTQDL